MAVASHELAIRLPDDEEDVCRRYGRAKLILNVAELVVLLSVLAGLTLTGASASLLALSHPYDVPPWLGDLSFLVCVGFISRAALFPVQCVNEYWLDRRFGLAWGSLGSWFWEWLSRSALFGLATALILFPVAETLRWWPLLALPWLFTFLLLRPLFFEYVYYPVLARFYPVRFLRYETFTLPGIGKTTLPVFEVQVSHKTRRANATIRLRGRKTAIYVTDTLIDEFTDGEERVVMAHEFGHLYDHLHLEARTRAGVAQAHRKLMLGSLQLVAGALSLLLLHQTAPFLGLRGAHDLAGFPLLAALTLLLARALSPFLCEEARRDERDADEYALLITGDIPNYLSVMRKLRRMNLEESCSSPLCRFLFDTHPTYSERAHLALNYRRRRPPRRKAPSWRGVRNIQRHGRR